MLLLPLAALAFRRGWLLVLLVLVGSTVSAPQPAMALGWDDLWLRPDQQAARALQAGEPAQAAQLARDPALRGTAEYQAGNYEAAQEAFATQADADADYNQGNALAQLQRYEEALAAYDRALEKQPQMTDALHNKAEIEKLLQQQQEQQQDQQQGESGEDADNQQGQQEQGAGDNQQDARNETGEQGSDDSQADAQNEPGEQNEQESSDAQQDAASSDEQQDGEGEDPADDAQQSADAQDADDAEGERVSEQQAEATAEEVAGQQAAAEAEPLDSEEQRAAEQWLRRIPDDPGGLLKRKFLYQYKQRAGRPTAGDQQAW